VGRAACPRHPELGPRRFDDDRNANCRSAETGERMEANLRRNTARPAPPRGGYNDWATAKVAYDRGDYTTALQFYRHMATEGDVRAQDTLGLMYENGLGVIQDYVAAMEWYRKAAAQGDAAAQFNLGNLFHDGRGASQHHAQAAKWYRMSAEQGHAQAQNNLAAMCEAGRGVKRDVAEAVYWY